MKIHIGVDSRTGLSHSAVVTAASAHDKHPLADMLHGNERRMYGDSAYASQKDLISSKAAHAKNFANQRLRNRNGEVNEQEESKEPPKSKVRARVEHVVAVGKRLCSFTSGLAKNTTPSFVALGLTNLYLTRGHLGS